MRIVENRASWVVPSIGNVWASRIVIAAPFPFSKLLLSDAVPQSISFKVAPDAHAARQKSAGTSSCTNAMLRWEKVILPPDFSDCTLFAEELKGVPQPSASRRPEDRLETNSM
jgi:hypothetical protein